MHWALIPLWAACAARGAFLLDGEPWSSSARMVFLIFVAILGWGIIKGTSEIRARRNRRNRDQAFGNFIETQTHSEPERNLAGQLRRLYIERGPNALENLRSAMLHNDKFALMQYAFPPEKYRDDADRRQVAKLIARFFDSQQNPGPNTRTPPSTSVFHNPSRTH